MKRAKRILLQKKEEGVELERFEFLTDPHQVPTNNNMNSQAPSNKVTDRTREENWSSTHRNFLLSADISKNVPGGVNSDKIQDFDIGVYAPHLSKFPDQESSFVRKGKEDERLKEFRNEVEEFQAYHNNSENVQKFIRKVSTYHGIFEGKLIKAGIRNEEDFLRFLTENYLIDTIPDDYEGYVNKLKDLLSEKIEKKYDEHNSVQMALRSLKLDERKHAERQRRQDELVANLKKQAISKSMNQVEFFKKHTRIGKPKYTNRQGLTEKELPREESTQVKPFLIRPLSKKSIFNSHSQIEIQQKVEEYFGQLNELTENIRDFRRQLFNDKKSASISEVDIKSDLMFAEEILIQYRDDAKKLLEEVEQMTKDFGPIF